MKTELGQSKEQELEEKRILVVDDNQDILELVEEVLSTMGGANVTTAKNGQEALEKIEKAGQEGFPFDLIITDLIMPGMDGRQLLKELNEKGLNIPTLMLTGAAEIEPISLENLHQESLHQVKDVLEKPINIVSLIKAAAQALEAQS